MTHFGARSCAVLFVVMIAAACRGEVPAGDPAVMRAEIMSEALRYRGYLGLTPAVFVERCALFKVLGLDSLPASFPDNEVAKLLRGLSVRSCSSADSANQPPQVGSTVEGNRAWIALRAKGVGIQGRNADAVFQLEWLGGTYLQHYLATALVGDGVYNWVINEVRLDNFGHY